MTDPKGVKMKRPRYLVLLLAAWLLPTLACNLPIQDQGPDKLATALFPLDTRTPISTFTMAPSPTRLQPSATQPITAGPPTVTPTYASGFSEPFDTQVTHWNDFWVLSTQAAGGKIQSTFGQKNGILTLNLVDKETYLYRFYTAPQPVNIYIEAELSIDGKKDNMAGLVCRAASDQSTWYEARVSGIGEFQIFRYNKARKTEQGLNPYLQLLQGTLDPGAWSQGQMNLIRFTCSGSRLTLDINQGKQRVEVEDTNIQAGGLVGFSAITYTNLPAVIQIDEINAGIVSP
jgi:hypothetical protein